MKKVIEHMKMMTEKTKSNQLADKEQFANGKIKLYLIQFN